MAEYKIQDTTLTEIADAIREKIESADAIAVSRFAELIRMMRSPILPEADTLDGCSWANISEITIGGNAANFWAIGDCKGITVDGTVGTLSVSGTYYVYIIGFAHNGANRTVDFGTFKTAATGGVDVCLTDSVYGGAYDDGVKYFNMNHGANSTSGGWKGCDLRYDVLGSTDADGADASENTTISPVADTLMAALPSDLREVMKPMTIYTDNTGNSNNSASAVTASVDYLPILAEYEVFGSRDYANTNEQSYQAQYAYYSAGNSKIKYKHGDTATAAAWWMRSAYYTGSTRFCNVSAGGGRARNYVKYSYGVAPIFRV